MARFFVLPVVFALWAPLLWLHLRAICDSDSRALWAEVLGDSLWVLIANSLLLAILTAVFGLFLGICAGFGVWSAPRKLQKIGAVLLAIPLAIPPVLATTPFFQLGDATPWALPLCAFSLAACYFPLGAAATLAALSSLGREEFDAARAHVSPPRAFFGVLRPHFAPFWWGAGGVMMALALWEMAAPDLLSVPTLSSEVYRQLSTPDGSNTAFRAALSSWPIPVLALMFLAPLAFWPGKNPASPARHDAQNFGVKILVSPVFLPLLWAPFLVSPMGALGRFLGEIDDYSALTTTLAASSDALRNTVQNGIYSATVCVVLALFFAWNLRFWRVWPRRIALCFLLLPGLFSPLVLGVALVEFWNRDEFAAIYDSASLVTIFGLCARFFPFALALCWLAIVAIGNAPLEAAQNLGASPTRTFGTVVLPLIKAQIVAIFALVFALSAGEITISVLTQGPGGEPLSISIFSFLHAGIASDVAALCLVLAGLSGGALGLASWMLRHYRLG